MNGLLSARYGSKEFQFQNSELFLWFEVNHRATSFLRFNYQTLQFEPSWTLRLQSFLVLICKCTWSLKLTVSWFFEQEDNIQLLIGTIRKLRTS